MHRSRDTSSPRTVDGASFYRCELSWMFVEIRAARVENQSHSLVLAMGLLAMAARLHATEPKETKPLWTHNQERMREKVT
jgi:hypothetical protein